MKPPDAFSPNFTDGELGAHLDFTLKPILRRELREGNWERDRYLWVRAGYVVSRDLDDRDDGSTTQTILLETTTRLELPGQFWLVNRARVDFRDIDGETSQRYRLRLGIEREFTVCGVVMVIFPYAQAGKSWRMTPDYSVHFQAGEKKRKLARRARQIPSLKTNGSPDKKRREKKAASC